MNRWLWFRPYIILLILLVSWKKIFKYKIGIANLDKEIYRYSLLLTESK